MSFEAQTILPNMQAGHGSGISNGYLQGFPMPTSSRSMRLTELYNFVNMFGKNPEVNIKPVLIEIARLLELPEGTING